jgi:hypothetical protein
MMLHDVVRNFDCGVPEAISLLCLKTRCSNAGTTALVYHRFNNSLLGNFKHLKCVLYDVDHAAVTALLAMCSSIIAGWTHGFAGDVQRCMFALWVEPDTMPGIR